MKAKAKHLFFLNPYENEGFTKCPKCETNTKIRRFPLVIHIEPQQLFVLNKKCKYCECCDLIIAKQFEVEELLAMSFETVAPEIIGNDYFVVGTLERQDWKKVKTGEIDSAELVDQAVVFKKVLDFEIKRGWFPKDAQDL